MSGQQRHACIIGGGIIGLTCAVELRSRGWRVTLCDAAASAREASWAAAGMLAPFNEAHDRDTGWQRGLASLAAWEPFLRRHAIQPEAVDLRRRGALLPIDDDRAAARAEELLTLFADHGVRRLDAKHLRGLTTSVACAEALWLPGGQVDPRRATAAFRHRAEQSGVDVRYQCSLVRIQHAATTTVTLRNINDQTLTSISCDDVVLAAGAWSPDLANACDLELPGEPVKGQMCLLKPAQTLGLHHFIHTPNAYMVERRDVGIVIGATMQTVGFNREPDPEGIQRLVDQARKIVPALEQAPLTEHWTGLRPRLHGGRLLVDRVRPGLAIATGHFRNGILLAPWTALRMADRLADHSRPAYEADCNW